MPSFRFTQKDINRGKLLDPGLWYRVKQVGVSEELSKKGDSMNITVDFEVLNGPFQGCVLYRMFSEKAPGFAIPYFKAFGVEVKEGDDYNFDALNGRMIEVFVKHREYEGKLSNDVIDFRPAD